MKISEIYRSIQGESSWIGLTTTFVRLHGCNLNCSYCDSKYATQGDDFTEMTIKEIGDKIIEQNCGIVEFTGGEPMIQSEEMESVMKYVVEKDFERSYHFLIETNGSFSINEYIKCFVQQPWINYYFIMDIKMPSSGMYNKMNMENLSIIRPVDEVKFVCGDRADYEIARKLINEHNIGNAIISPIFGKIEPKQLVEWILEDQTRARFQIQLHKIIWGPMKRGV